MNQSCKAKYIISIKYKSFPNNTIYVATMDTYICSILYCINSEMLHNPT